MPNLYMGNPSVLSAQAIRPSGPQQGYDQSYLQNLATSIGGMFANQGGGSLSFNPLGNLSEVSPKSGEIGNAPDAGLPGIERPAVLMGESSSTDDSNEYE